VPSQNKHLIDQLLGLEHTKIHQYARQRVGAQEADDMVQEAYLHLLQRNKNSVIHEPQTFLFRIIANLSIDAWRKRKRRGDDVSIPDCSVDFDNLPCLAPSVEELIDNKLRFQDFLKALDELPELQRHAFILSKIEGLSHAQIADQLGICTKSVSRHLVNAMAHFAERFGF